MVNSQIPVVRVLRTFYFVFKFDFLLTFSILDQNFEFLARFVLAVQPPRTQRLGVISTKRAVCYLDWKAIISG